MHHEPVSAVPLAVLLLAACAGGSKPPTQPVPQTSAASQTGEATDLYLSPGETGGGKLCFNPDSPRLRRFLTAPRPKADDPVDARALAEDLPFLQDALRLQYSGYAQFVQRSDFNLASFFEQWQRDLMRAGATVSFERGVLGPLRTLRTLFPDNHHTVWGPSLHDEPAFVTREYQAAVPGPDAVGPLASCQLRGEGTAFPDTLRVARVLGREGTTTVLTVSVRGGGDRLAAQCPRATFELTPRPPLAEPPPLTPVQPLYAWRSVGDTAVITVRGPAVTSAQEKQLEQLVKDYDAHRRFARIVFDFRENRGGIDTYIYHWIAKAKRGLWDAGADWELRGALTPCQLWNPLVQMQIRDGSVDTAAAREERVRLRAKWPPGPHRPTWVYRGGLSDERAEQPYTGRVWVLVNRYVGSAGEGGAMALKGAMGAALIGERTDGTIEYGNQRAIVLPHSGIRWSFATKRNLFEHPVEGVGVPADAYLVDSTLPVEQILPMLTRLE